VTILEGVFYLPPGHRAAARPGARRTPRARPVGPHCCADASSGSRAIFLGGETLRPLLEDAVAQSSHRRSARGLFLSSGNWTTAHRRRSPRSAWRNPELNTDVPGTASMKRRLARLAANRFKTKAHPKFAFERRNRYCASDEISPPRPRPPGTRSIRTLLTGRREKSGLKVDLSGGGDEFCGLSNL